MNLKSVPYTRLLKLELPSLARKVIGIVEKHDPELLKINEVYEMLLAQMPNINMLTNSFGAHPLTPQIKTARKLCHWYAQWITYNMKCVVKENASNLTIEVLNAASLVKDCLHRLVRSKNELVMIERVSGFFDAIDSDEEMTNLFNRNKLTDSICSLRGAHTNLIELLMKRTKSISERPNLKTKEIAAPVIKALKDIIKQIEVAPLANSNLNYSPLFNELNEIIQNVKNQVNKRVLHNKCKAEKKDEKDINRDTTTLVESTPVMNSLIEESTKENVFKNEHEEQFEEEMIVASSTIHLQQPSVLDGT